MKNREEDGAGVMRRRGPFSSTDGFLNGKALKKKYLNGSAAAELSAAGAVILPVFPERRKSGAHYSCCFPGENGVFHGDDDFFLPETMRQAEAAMRCNSSKKDQCCRKFSHQGCCCAGTVARA